jgi:flagellar hook protein FlgE
MLRPLSTGASGIKAHKQWLGVISNNVANINTAGFKRSRVTFGSVLAKVQGGSSSPDAKGGGTNPTQVGLGVDTATIDIIHTQGSLKETKRTTDLAIEGDGFFVLRDPEGKLHFQRDGAFGFDADGNLVDPSNGNFVQGFIPGHNPVSTQDINVKLGSILPAKATSKITLSQNLNASQPTALDPVDLDIRIGDLSVPINITFEHLLTPSDPTEEYGKFFLWVARDPQDKRAC